MKELVKGPVVVEKEEEEERANTLSESTGRCESWIYKATVWAVSGMQRLCGGEAVSHTACFDLILELSGSQSLEAHTLAFPRNLCSKQCGKGSLEKCAKLRL